MKSLNEYIEEQLSDVKTKWHPKDGLFTEKDPKKIVDYLLKNSKDRGQAMKRLTFYMNRAGDKLSNKTVLNKAKDMLKENVNEKLIIIPSQVDEKLIVNKNYRIPNDKKCLMILILFWDTSIDSAHKRTVMLQVHDDSEISGDTLYMNYSSSKQPEMKWKDKEKCYYWSTSNSAIDLYVIGLVGVEAIEFLNNLLKGNSVPKEININNYYTCAPDELCPLIYYDDKSKKYLHYNKNDINKLIDQLYK